MTDELTLSPQEGNDKPEKASMMEVAASRQAQEVQAAMVIAQRFPRDLNAAYAKIMQACKRPKLAEASAYAYPRGNTTVTGPSIRLAEVLAQNYGNLDFGIIELEQRAGESVMMAYAWDLESNTRQTKVFNVKHSRYTKRGTYALTDPRDIYEMTANQGARRLRACVLGVIPGDVVDAALAECEKTLQGDNKEPLIDRVRKMVAAFSEIAVSQEMVETRLGHKLEVTSEQELVTLRKIYSSIKDNMADIRQFFDFPSEDDPTKSTTSNLKSKIKKAKKATSGTKNATSKDKSPLEGQKTPPKYTLLVKGDSVNFQDALMGLGFSTGKHGWAVTSSSEDKVLELIDKVMVLPDVGDPSKVVSETGALTVEVYGADGVLLSTHPKAKE